MCGHLSLALFVLSCLHVHAKTLVNSELGPLNRINEGIADGEKVPLLPPVEQSTTFTTSTVASFGGPQVTSTATPEIPTLPHLPTSSNGSSIPSASGLPGQVPSFLSDPFSSLLSVLRSIESVVLTNELSLQTLIQLNRFANFISENAIRVLPGK